MTASEAIDILQKEEICRKFTPCGLQCSKCPWYVKHKDYKEAYHMAITALAKLKEEDE